MSKRLWSLEFSSISVKQLKKLDKKAAQNITTYLKTRLMAVDDPRALGKALRGDMDELWRYRVGDYRIIAEIIDHRLVIYILKIGHRKDIYD